MFKTMKNIGKQFSKNIKNSIIKRKGKKIAEKFQPVLENHYDTILITVDALASFSEEEKGEIFDGVLDALHKAGSSQNNSIVKSLTQHLALAVGENREIILSAISNTALQEVRYQVSQEKFAIEKVA